MGIQSNKVTAGVAPYLEPGERVRVVLLTRPLQEAERMKARLDAIGLLSALGSLKRIAVVGTDEHIYVFGIRDEFNPLKLLSVEPEGWQRYPVASAPLVADDRSITVDGLQLAVLNRIQRNGAEQLMRLVGGGPRLAKA